MELVHRDLTKQIIGAFYAVYDELGSGFLESVYELALAFCLEDAGLNVQRQVPIDVWFRGRVAGEFRADLVVDSIAIIEVKACERLLPVHHAQLINYLKATDLEVGLLVNFGPRIEFKRKVWSRQKRVRENPPLSGMVRGEEPSP